MTVKNNKKVKVVVLCIIVATTFWFFNAMNNHYTTNVNFPLKYDVQSSQLKLTSSVPNKIGINVYGTGWDILKVSLNLGFEPYFFELNSEEEILFKSSTLMPYISHELAKLKVNFIHEKNWTVRTDSILTKKIKLEGFLEESLENIVVLKKTIVRPDSILVTGPRLYLDSLDNDMVLTVNHISQIGEQDLEFELKDWINPELKTSTNQVNINFTIDNLIEESEFLYNKDSTNRQLVKYTKPESYARLSQEELSNSIINQTPPSFYTILSAVLDTTNSLNYER